MLSTDQRLNLRISKKNESKKRKSQKQQLSNFEQQFEAQSTRKIRNARLSQDFLVLVKKK